MTLQTWTTSWMSALSKSALVVALAARWLVVVVVAVAVFPPVG